MRTKLSFLLSCFLLPGLAACGGSTTGGSAGPGSVTGTVAGITLNVASEIAALESASETGSCSLGADGGSACSPSIVSHGVAVIFTNRPDETCPTIQSDAVAGKALAFANTQSLTVGVNVANGDVVPGTYAVTSSSDISVTGVSAYFGATTATCGLSLALTATSGTVTVTQFSATSVTGTYAVTFGTQGTFSGAFDVPLCIIDGGSGTAPTAVCHP